MDILDTTIIKKRAVASPTHDVPSIYIKKVVSLKTQPFLYVVYAILFLATVAITTHELINTTGGVNKFLFSGEEWVRRTSDFEFHKGISHTINFNCFFSGDCRASDEDFLV